MDLLSWDIEILQHKSGLLPIECISFNINDYKSTPNTINNIEKSERSVKPKIVNIVHRVKGEVLKYLKIQSVLKKQSHRQILSVRGSMTQTSK